MPWAPSGSLAWTKIISLKILSPLFRDFMQKLISKHIHKVDAQKMIAKEKNPFPSGGVTRPGIQVKNLVDLPSQQGAVERIEELVRSVASHGSVQESHEGVGQTHVGKPEFVVLSGPFGSGKTLIMRKVYDDCKAGGLKIGRGQNERKLVAVPIYQPLHALISNPANLIDILMEKLASEVPGARLKQEISKARTAPSTAAKSDELLTKINHWRQCVDAAIDGGVDSIVLLLDELEESIGDYSRYAAQYDQMLSAIREFADREVGPVVIVLGATPVAIDALVSKSKQALFRRMVPLALPNLTSPDELRRLILEYDSTADEYLDKNGLKQLYAETNGNPGFAMESLHWAWEEMKALKKDRIDSDLVYQAAQTVTWKGQPIRAERQSSTRYTETMEALDSIKSEIEKPKQQDVIRGIVNSLSAIGSIQDADERLYASMKDAFEARGVSLAPTSTQLCWIEPFADVNVSYLTLVLLADDDHFDESNFKNVLEGFGEQGGDFVLLAMPTDSTSARRNTERVLQNATLRGVSWNDLTIKLILNSDAIREFAALARFTGTPREMGEAQESISYGYGIADRFKSILNGLHAKGKTLPYRWELKRFGEKKETIFGLYNLLARRFTDEKFTPEQAVDWVSAHYQLVPVLKATVEKSGVMSVREWAGWSVGAELEVLTGQNLATKTGDSYFIPPVVPYERELYNAVSTLRSELGGRSPGSDDIKPYFFGLRKARGYDIFAIGYGMEGKGYLQCLQEGARRFYSIVSPQDRLTAVEVTLSQIEKDLPGTVAQRTKDARITLAPESASAFAAKIRSNLAKDFTAARRYLSESQKTSGDVFEKLRLISKADTTSLVIQDQVATQIAKWLSVKNELTNSERILNRQKDTTENPSYRKKLNPKKAAELGKQIAQLLTKVPQASEKLDNFETNEAESIVSEISKALPKIDEALSESLQEFARAERDIVDAESGLQTIREAVDPESEASKSLGIDKELAKTQAAIDTAKADSANGKAMGELPLESPMAFLSRVVDPKFNYIQQRLDGLQRAEKLLSALGQSEDADKLVMSNAGIQSTTTKAGKLKAQGFYKQYVQATADALDDVNKAAKALDRLNTLYLGAMRQARSQFEKDGVDAAISKTLAPLTTDQARDLRHLLEDMGDIRCLDISST